MKIERLLAITMMLINKKKVTAKELADYFEVSVRTIQRDMDHLSMAGVPLFSDVGKSGGYSMVEDYKMDKNFLKEDEATMLISLLKNFQSLVPYDEAKTMTKKLEVLYPDKSQDDKIIFKLSPFVNGSKYREFMGMLTKARERQNKVEVTYMDAQFMESKRIICPYRLVMMGSVWYVYAYCEKRNDFRLFKVSRIIACNVQEENFELQTMPENVPWEMFDDDVKTSVPMILELDLCLKGNIPDYFDYKSCKVLEDKIVVSIAYPVDEWMYSLLLSLVPYIRVIEPKWVREEMIRRLETGIEKMKTQNKL